MRTATSEAFVLASANGHVGMDAAIETLRAGGSAVDAVEAGVRQVESNLEDTSVGLGGLPNVLGEVELDASIMDGATRTVGAVGAVRGYEHVITLARRVMEELPHVLLVGTGAERFAAELGMEHKDLLTESARERWQARVRDALGRDDPDPARPDFRDEVRTWARSLLDPTRNTGTVNVIARDRAGNLAGGVSTSGWESKYPGRLGDSPVIGAGNYADNRYGAAACTGHGEATIRCATAHSVVLYLKMGMPVERAMAEASADTALLEDPYAGGVDILAVDRHGTIGATTTGDSGATESATFVYQTTAMPTWDQRPRTVLPR